MLLDYRPLLASLLRPWGSVLPVAAAAAVVAAEVVAVVAVVAAAAGAAEVAVAEAEQEAEARHSIAVLAYKTGIGNRELRDIDQVAGRT